MDEGKIKRRDFLRLAGITAAGSLLAACGGAAAPAAAPTTGTAAEAPTTAAPADAPTATVGAAAADPTATTAAAAEPTAATTADVTPTRAVPRGEVTERPRESTLIMAFGDGGDLGIGNQALPGFNHQRGMMALLEPLYFYSAYGEGNIPWLADGEPEYSADATEVIIKTRQGAEWSDGTPFTAKDVAFTLNMLRDPANEGLPYASDMTKWVKNAEAVDDQTAKVTFNQAAPRFVYDFLSYKFDLGLHLVPEHIFKDQTNIAEFLFYDPAQGWPVTTGPYKIADWTPQQRILDRRDDWWATKTGFAQLPEVERIVVVPWPDSTLGAQSIINNEFDTSLDMRPPVIKAVVEANEKIITHSNREAPYGYMDWWPQSLYFNCSTAPFDDPDIRRAINHTIDRNQIIEVGYEGAGAPAYLPFPDFPSLQPFFDAVKPLLEQYPTDAYDLAKVDEIMMGKGYTKDGDGLWVGADGARIDATVYGFTDLQGDYASVLAEQLRLGGFDASFQGPADSYTRMDDGTGSLFVFGFASAIADPFPSLDNMHSRRDRPTGETGGIITRWKNEEFDKIIDELSLLPVGDPKGIPLAVQATEIYLKELPHIPVVQWLHRIPYNTTYWTGWPTVDDLYVNGAFWHKTFPLILHRLKKTA